MFVKELWIVDTNVKKCAIMENVNVSKKLLSNADVVNKKSKLFVEGKLYVWTNVQILFHVDINVESNVIKKVVSRLINITHVKNFVKKSDQIVDTVVDNIAIQAKSVLNFLVKLKFS